jgi:hypothetical protein
MTIVRRLSLSLAAISAWTLSLPGRARSAAGASMRGQRSERRVVLCRTHGRRGERPVPPGLWRNAKLAVGVGLLRAGRIDQNGGDRAAGHRASGLSSRPVLPLLQPGKGQLGVIGDDLLSQFTVQLTENTTFLSAGACRPDALIARGLTPVAQNGFFSSDPSKTRRLPAQRAARLPSARRRSRMGPDRHSLRGLCPFPLCRHQPGSVRPAD